MLTAAIAGRLDLPQNSARKSKPEADLLMEIQLEQERIKLGHPQNLDQTSLAVMDKQYAMLSNVKKGMSALGTDGDDTERVSPGPGQYLGLYEHSEFKQRLDNVHSYGRKQEFGSLRPRFDGPEEIRREEQRHLGPGCYSQTHQAAGNQYSARLMLPPQPHQGFGSKISSDGRHGYILEHQAARMKTPGIYGHVEKRRGKVSHNKGNKNIYTQEERRFQVMDNKVPGPGAYIDTSIENDLLLHKDPTIGKSARKKAKAEESGPSHHGSSPMLPYLPQSLPSGETMYQSTRNLSLKQKISQALETRESMKKIREAHSSISPLKQAIN